MRNATPIAAILVLLAACGSEPGEPGVEKPEREQLTATTLGEQTILTTSEYLAQKQFSAADKNNGSRQGQICKACHSIDVGGANMIGPALHGMFGRGAGRLDGFAYSDVLLEAEFVWTPRALDAWLAQPGLFLPGNRMTFAGVFKQSDRDDLIAWLLAETSADGVE